MSLPCARNHGLTVRELPEETQIYDIDRRRTHCLNRSASLVWRHCDGRTTVAEMARILQTELKMPADEHLVQLALEELRHAQLLEGKVCPVPTRSYLFCGQWRALGAA